MRTPKFLPGITFLRDPPRSFSFRRKCSFVGKKGNKKSGKSDLGAFERRGKKLPHRRFLYYILTLSRDSIFGRNSPPRLHNSSGQKSAGNFFCLSLLLHSALLGRYPLQIFEMLLVFEYFSEQCTFSGCSFFHSLSRKLYPSMFAFLPREEEEEEECFHLLQREIPPPPRLSINPDATRSSEFAKYVTKQQLLPKRQNSLANPSGLHIQVERGGGKTAREKKQTNQ